MEGKNEDIKKMMQFIFTIYVGKLKSGNQTDLNDNYAWLLTTLDNQEKGSPDKKETYDKMRGIIHSFHELVTRPEIGAEIRETGIKEEDFMRKYKEEIFGEPKRKYDMKDLYRDSLISTYNNDKRKEYITPHSKPIELEYKDRRGRTVKLSNVAELQYSEWNGTKTNLSMYKVQKEQENGEFSEDYVYSNILIANMDEPEYREAVLDELLSDNNIGLSNSGGYVGEIALEPREGKGDKLYTEKQKAGRYTYRVSENYVLAYEEEAVTAAINEPARNIDTKNNVIPFRKADGMER